MMMMKAAILRTRPQGGSLPKPNEDICVEYIDYPKHLKDKPSFICKNLYLSLDPAILGWLSPSTNSYLPPIAVGEIMRCAALSRVVSICVSGNEVKSYKGYDVGDVLLTLGPNWCEYSLNTLEQIQGKVNVDITKKLGLPLRCWLGPLGGPGVTAYFGLMEIGKPKKGETVVVSAAAGATGSVACQIAKYALGCKVVGIAGGKEKCEWLVNELGLDGAIDYQVSKEEFRKQINKACPNGVDVFFDNVGGTVLDEVLRKINFQARVVLCGFMSLMGPSAEDTGGPANYVRLVQKSAKMEGFIALNYAKRNGEAHGKLAEWLSEGKIKFKEELYDGVDEAPRAFLRLFSKGSSNKGKVLVQVHKDDTGDEIGKAKM